jgi:formate hydrogenlyase subunit 4
MTMLSLTLILFSAVFFTGTVNRTKSLASGRKGPGIIQPVKDVIRLLGRELS